MKQVLLNVPTFGFIVSTRAILGLGMGLLLAGKLTSERRRAMGALLVIVGAAATVPALAAVAKGLVRSRRPLPAAVASDRALIGVTWLPRKGDDDVL